MPVDLVSNSTHAWLLGADEGTFAFWNGSKTVTFGI